MSNHAEQKTKYYHHQMAKPLLHPVISRCKDLVAANFIETV